MEKYLAHITQDGRLQTVEEHLVNTAKLCSEFAADFGATEYGYLAGMCHDIGKRSDAFLERLNGGPKVDHATAGAIECARIREDFVAACIIGHHSGLPDFGSNSDMAGAPTYVGRLKNGMNGKIPEYVKPTSLPKPRQKIDLPQDDFIRSMWIRMLYSCLVDADFLDTEDFMQNGNVDRGGYDTINELNKRFLAHINKWSEPKSELDRIRGSILHSCIDGGKKPKGIYTLTVPTGGGKTTASLGFALNHAATHGMKRIIYVIPYTSIIEQNAAVFRDILGDKNVLEHHCNVVIDRDDAVEDENVRYLLATENWDSPIVVTTAVRFFESFYANRSSKCRKLHNLANSVIIFDEAQMLPSAHLKPCSAAIAALAEHFNSTVLLCTATQPELGDYMEKYAPSKQISELCPGTDELFARMERVTYDDIGKVTNDELAAKLSGFDQVLCVVNTRKLANTLFALLPKEGSYHLSTLMYPKHRKATLDEIRSRLKSGLPCRVVSTSLIEAGVDIDFPYVFREKAGLDSIMQAGGRCNREGKRDSIDSVVTVFTSELPTFRVLAMNIQATNEAISGGSQINSASTISKYFTAYRSLIGNGTDKNDIVSKMAEGISGCRYPFRTVADDFHLIDNNTFTVYIKCKESEPILDAITNGACTKKMYSELGKYSINVYQNHYLALLRTGDVVQFLDESGILVNDSLYSDKTGLSLVAEEGKGLFI